MSLKEFIECFNDSAAIKIVLSGDDSVLYDGDAQKLKYLLKANTKPGTGKLENGRTVIKVTPF